jgi:hypothetical protein
MELFDKYKKTRAYTCKHCSREYKEKFNYDRHVGFCEFSYKTARETNDGIEAFDTIPSLNEIFGYVKELSLRVDKLEKENSRLKQFAQQQKKKVDILDWLNNRYEIIPDQLFTAWMTNLNVAPFLNDVFEYDLLSALIKCFDKSIEDSEKLPIRTFSQKANTFYIYDKTAGCEENPPTYKWSIITNKQLDKWFTFIAQRFISEFKAWHDANKPAIDADENMKERYYDYFQKILGGKMSDDTRNHRIRQVMYGKLKQNLKNVVEFEFV